MRSCRIYFNWNYTNLLCYIDFETVSITPDAVSLEYVSIPCIAEFDTGGRFNFPTCQAFAAIFILVTGTPYSVTTVDKCIICTLARKSNLTFNRLFILCNKASKKCFFYRCHGLRDTKPHRIFETAHKFSLKGTVI